MASVARCGGQDSGPPHLGSTEQDLNVFVALHAVMNRYYHTPFHSMPLVGIQRRAWTATTLLPTFSAADANSLEIVASIELAMSCKTPFLNCESRIGG
jgi:hypothetical protein